MSTSSTSPAETDGKSNELRCPDCRADVADGGVRLIWKTEAYNRLSHVEDGKPVFHGYAEIIWESVTDEIFHFDCCDYEMPVTSADYEHA